MKRALFIQPHPDDNEIGAGATIAKLIADGIEVHYLTVTNGESGSYNVTLSTQEIIEIRRKEQLKAGHLLGVKQFHWLNFLDGHLFDTEDLRAQMMKVVRQVNPDIIFTVDPWLPYEAHIDHSVTGRVASFVARTCGNPHFYPEQLTEGERPELKAIAYYTTHRPNTYINVDDFWELKLSAIQAHNSQFSGDHLDFLKAYFTQKAIQMAAKAPSPCQFAEGFKILSPLMLHSNVDALNM
ncbi:LmbE family N-acetylglucosaminyl deacetylase [Pullulanibacillus pueri]|nr:PIG-L deacetylase family protein [Pullulanibacillus pueri]MBM7680938.1 LmbE family N-acetylglucosaminyl deacetylase [Pullulanibacillus pueri]